MQRKQKGIFNLFQSNKNSRIGGNAMKSKKVLWSILTVIMLLSMTVGAVMAGEGDGIPIGDSGIFRRNISKTPDQETERANLNHMSFYVPAQTAEGLLTPIDYYMVEDCADPG